MNVEQKRCKAYQGKSKKLEEKHVSVQLRQTRILLTVNQEDSSYQLELSNEHFKNIFY
jgi:hypothetical protein